MVADKAIHPLFNHLNTHVHVCIFIFICLFLTSVSRFYGGSITKPNPRLGLAGWIR